jgi:hypothetical protein
VAETTQPREHRRRSRATDTAELDAAAALVQLTSLVPSIYSRIAVRHDLTPARGAPDAAPQALPWPCRYYAALRPAEAVNLH